MSVALLPRSRVGLVPALLALILVRSLAGTTHATGSTSATPRDDDAMGELKVLERKASTEQDGVRVTVQPLGGHWRSLAKAPFAARSALGVWTSERVGDRAIFVQIGDRSGCWPRTDHGCE